MREKLSQKQIEITVLRDEAGASDAGLGKGDAKARRERIVKRAAQELKDGVCLLSSRICHFDAALLELR